MIVIACQYVRHLYCACSSWAQYLSQIVSIAKEFNSIVSVSGRMQHISKRRNCLIKFSKIINRLDNVDVSVWSKRSDGRYGKAAKLVAKCSLGASWMKREESDRDRIFVRNVPRTIPSKFKLIYISWHCDKQHKQNCIDQSSGPFPWILCCFSPSFSRFCCTCTYTGFTVNSN